MRSPGLALGAAAVLALEGVALSVFVVIEVIGIGSGAATSVPTALALTVLTLAAAIALFAFAIGARAGRSWARSGGVAFQVLAFAVALASLSVQPVPWLFVVGVGGPALLGFVLLLASTRAEHPRPGHEGSGVDSEDLA